MGNYLSSVKKVLAVYATMLILSIVFVLPFYKQMHIYSFVVLFLFALILYSEIADLAKKEKQPQYNNKTFLLKGFVIGLISIIPLILILLILPLINIETTALNFGALKDLILKALFMPIYFIAKIGNKSLQSYLIAIAIIPLISGIGYISGYYGISITEVLSTKFGIKLPTAKRKPKRK